MGANISRYLPALFVLLHVMSSGCSAPVKLGKLYADVESDPVGDDVARLVIYHLEYYGYNSSVNVKIDDVKVGRLQSNTFRRHLVPPGNVKISADRSNVAGKVMDGALVVLSVGGAAKSVKKANARYITAPAEVVVTGGEVYFFRVDKNSVSIMEECNESRGEARLCEATKFETMVTQISPDLARQEIMMLSEVVDDSEK